MTETLNQRLLCEPSTRTELVDALTLIVGEEIRNGSGLRRATLRSAVATLEKMKTGFVRRAVDKLLPEWIDVLEKHYSVYRLAPHGTFGAFIIAHKAQVAEELLTATAERAERSGNRVVKVLFARLQPTARANLTAAVPRLARAVDGVLYGV